ncbi:hypothetical protein EBS02_06700 [bacterium]|nr:hypothetical protein [bacterium]
MSTKTPITTETHIPMEPRSASEQRSASEPPRSASEQRSASEPPRSASEQRSASEPPRSASEPSIATAETPIVTEEPIAASDASIATPDTFIDAAAEPIVTAKTLLIEEASIIFGVCIEEIQYVLENGIRMETQYDICREEITTLSELQLIALEFVIKHYGDKVFCITMPKWYGMNRNIDADELIFALSWIEKFDKFKHICETDQHDCDYYLTVDWRPPVPAVTVKSSFTPVEGSLESMLQVCHSIIVKRSNGWPKQLDAQLTAIKRRFPSIYFKELNSEIVSTLEESNDRIRFADLKRRILQAVRSYLLGCISNVENDIAHEYSVDEQRSAPVESSTSRVKSLISAIDKLTSFIRAISRIFKDIPATLKNFYWSRMIRQSGQEESDDLSCLLDFAGVALADDFHETSKYGCEPEIDYYDRRTLGGSMGGPTNSNENSKPELRPETLSDVVNSQPEYAKYIVDRMHPDLQYVSRNPLKFDMFDADTAPDNLFASPIEEEDETDDFDYNSPIKGVLPLGRYDRQLLLILMAIGKMQKIVDAAESSLTPDNEATHESANAEYNTQFKPILDEMVSKLNGILSIFNGLIAQCDEALAVPEISAETLKQVNTVLKKNKAPAAEKTDAKEKADTKEEVDAKDI